MDAIAAPRVLVVDDEPQVVWVLRFGLESEGYDVATAHRSVEALEQISSTAPS
jgi:CheY-like chemotaxis protein